MALPEADANPPMCTEYATEPLSRSVHIGQDPSVGPGTLELRGTSLNDSELDRADSRSAPADASRTATILFSVVMLFFKLSIAHCGPKKSLTPLINTPTDPIYMIRLLVLPVLTALA